MRLTMTERRVLRKSFARAYRKGSREAKGKILDDFTEMTGYNRNYGARLLRGQGRRLRWSDKRVVFQGDVSRNAVRR